MGARGEAQSAPAPAEGAAPAVAQTDPLSQLTPAQHDAFKVAADDVAAGRFSEALPRFKDLLGVTPLGSPAQILIAKYTAESALNSDEGGYALSLLQPIETANPDDWQARSLLARAYQEAGRKADRDAELAALVALHKASPGSQIGKLNQILLERDHLADGGAVRIWYSLEPWGRYKTYVFSRIYGADGRQVSMVTLESSDFDQPSFVKEHPDLAAKGERRFSMDGYTQGQPNAQGQMTQTHATYGFFDGQPPYDTVRERILEIANQKTKPIASTTGGATPKQ